MTRFFFAFFLVFLLAGCASVGPSDDRGDLTRVRSLVTEVDHPGPMNTSVIHYDESFLWMSRNFGSENLPTHPGLFVHSKASGTWRRILRVSTKDGKFGSSESENLLDRGKLLGSSISWNFTGLKNEAWAEVPLATPGAVLFPDKVEFDRATDRYKLRFMSAWNIRSAETVLWISRKDLAAEFEGRKN